MSTTLALALAVASAALAEPRGDLAKFQGKWELTSSEKDGKKQPIGVVRTVKGDEYFFTKDGKEVAKGKIKLDEKASPRAIDITRAGAGPMLGIYSFDGDTQKVCIAPPGKPRPKEFTSKEGHILSVWKKVK